MFSCDSWATSRLVGTWKIKQVTDGMERLNDKTLQVVTLVFKKNKEYVYTGTLRYQETGVFSVKKNVLFLSNRNGKTRGIQMESLKRNTLVLIMTDSGKTRTMIFFRKIT